MITTTAAIVGHVGIEFTKLAFGFKEMEDFKQVFMNFALPMIQISENEPCQQFTISKESGKHFTVWDFVDMTGNPTIQDVINVVKEKYGVVVDGIMYGAKSVYMSFMDDESKKGMKIRDVLHDMKVADAEEMILTLLPEEDDCDLPSLRLR